MPGRRHVLPRTALASVVPAELAAYIRLSGWSRDAAHWLTHQTPIDRALLYLAISERRSPREMLDDFLEWKRAEEARIAAGEPSPPPPNTKRSRRP